MSEKQSSGPFTRDEIDTWARLERARTAAYESYVENCGARAIECAEGDLLGDLLDVCEAMVEALSVVVPNVVTRTAKKFGEEVLAKAKGEEPK